MNKLITLTILLLSLSLQAKNASQRTPNNEANQPYHKSLTIDGRSQQNLDDFKSDLKNGKISIATDDNEDGKLTLKKYSDFRKESQLSADLSKITDLGCGQISSAYRLKIIKTHKKEMTVKLKNQISDADNTTCVFKDEFNDGSAVFVGYIVSKKAGVFPEVLVVGFDD